DHDPLYRFEQWQANLRILEVTEIKTVPYVPLSHPFVERLVGARFDASIWIARCSGPLRISKTSCSISEHTSTIIAPMLHCKDERLTKTRLCRDPSPISVPMDGKATVEASITHQGLPDSPKTRAPRSIQRTSTNCTANEPSRCLSW